MGGCRSLGSDLGVAKHRLTVPAGYLTSEIWRNRVWPAPPGPNWPGQLVPVGGADHDVALESGVGDLARHVCVGGAHDHPGEEKV